MQKPDPADSRPTVPTLDSLPKPELVQTSNVIVMLIFAAFAIYCLFNQNWLGATIDGGICVTLAVIAYFRYRKVAELRRQIRVLKVMETIINTPTMREEANSVIFTFIFPSPAIMDELHKLHSQAQKAKE